MGFATLAAKRQSIFLMQNLRATFEKHSASAIDPCNHVFAKGDAKMKIVYERGVLGPVTKVVVKVNRFTCVTTLAGTLTKEEAIQHIAAGKPI